MDNNTEEVLKRSVKLNSVWETTLLLKEKSCYLCQKAIFKDFLFSLSLAIGITLGGRFC